MLGPPLLGRQYTSHLDEIQDAEMADGTTPAAAASSPAGGASAAGAATTLKRAHPDRQAKLRFASATDIGGGQTNQDASDMFEIPGENCVVFGVYDGHGRELGELASSVAKESIRAALMEPGAIARVRMNPEHVLVDVFKRAHDAIREAFRKRYESTGWEVQDTDEGFLIKRQNPTQPWSCTHGGTTATLVIILDGWRMIVANVGDSTALWGGIDLEAQTLHRELSAEHSPESVEEFERVRKFKALVGHDNPSGPIPEMRFVYDAPSFSKSQCPPIFELAANGTIRVTGNGRYYKNVRSEWATLVTTPPNARFQDALAFTRSLGDLHLHVYGVSCRPTVAEYDLTALHSLVTSSDESPESRLSVLLVCTDGVWDNWKYPDVIAASLSPDLVSSVKTNNSAQGATDRLMTANIRRAKEHFGNQADNMTAIVCYISF